MAAITQLDPPLPLDTPKGSALAHLVIDYGPEHDLMWVVFLDADGACWTVPNPEVRMAWNWSFGRRKPARKPDFKPERREQTPRPLHPVDVASG